MARNKRYRSLMDYLDHSGDTQVSLAARLGITQGALSRYIHGNRFPRPVLALRLSRLTGVPLELLAKARQRPKSREAA